MMFVRYSFLFVLILAISGGAIPASYVWANTQSSAATTITVTTGEDYNSSASEVCSGRPKNKCSLRRAIVEAKNAPKPVVIQFNIPQADPTYNAGLQVWVLEINKGSWGQYVFHLRGGDITIDATTQPHGRASGPKIILRSTSKWYAGFEVGAIDAEGGYTIRGFGFQNFGGHITLRSDGNLVEDNWFGLTEDGNSVFLLDNDPGLGSGAGVSSESWADNNIVRRNTFVGADGPAALLMGKNNTFEDNLLGTRADGTIPSPPAGKICDNDTWLGGGGVIVRNYSNPAYAHTVRRNRFVGLRYHIDLEWGKNAHPIAIVVHGASNNIISNSIGIDSTGRQMFVCGPGIQLDPNPDPKYTVVADNTIVDPGKSGIIVDGDSAIGNTLTKNVIIQSRPWLLNESAIKLGPEIPDAVTIFQPARITMIDGTSVKGTAGIGSPCPGCVIEVFLDDVDDIVEAKRFLASTQADADGKWSVTLPAALDNNEELRTTSTAQEDGVIPGMSAGTTTKLSEGYKSPISPIQQLFLPTIIK